MALVDLIRDGPPRDYLLSGAYHTPNGHLHLGHLGGPFLSADVMARHLETLGHRVTRITSTDAYEAYVLLASRLERRPPREVAAFYWRSAADVLEAFDLHYDSFIDFSVNPWATEHHKHCQGVAERMQRRGRTEVLSVSIPRSRRSGRFLVGPFVLGRCPLCGADAAGTACEACGMWFGPAELEDVRPRLEEDGDVVWETFPTVFLRVSDELTVDEVERRFPAGYTPLLERFLAHNGGRLHLTHPLGWGVPWCADELPPGTVHVSYGTGSHAATVVTGLEYRRLTGAEQSPFHRASGVTTILTGGYDAALPCMMVVALKDVQSDFDPYRHHVMNQFMLLEGRKFSTSTGHVILGSEYIEAGLSSDLFRLYAARLFSAYREGDFILSEFGEWANTFLGERVEPIVRAALERTGAHEPEPLDQDVAVRVARALTEQTCALALPDTDLARASDAIERWLAVGESETVAAYWWLKTLAVLTYPFMPRWSTGLWQCLGGGRSPSVAGLELRAVARPETYEPLLTVREEQLARLARSREEAHARVDIA
jgi:methionyl-tRNA synthetase